MKQIQFRKNLLIQLLQFVQDRVCEYPAGTYTYIFCCGTQ